MHTENKSKQRCNQFALRKNSLCMKKKTFKVLGVEEIKPELIEISKQKAQKGSKLACMSERKELVNLILKRRCKQKKGVMNSPLKQNVSGIGARDMPTFGGR